jgi:hypothetical protein
MPVTHLTPAEETEERRQRLLSELDSEEPTTRAAAARSLGREGGDAVEALVAALNDEEPVVRRAAARSLGEVGDERAVQPLLTALRAGCVGKSPRKQIIAGVLMLGVGLLFAALAITRITAFKIGAVWWLFWAGSWIYNYFKGRREAGETYRALTDALVRIAERCPTPELRNAVPDLRAIAADFVQQGRVTRLTTQAAADRIETLTEKLKSMPVASAAPGMNATVLPRAAEAPEPDARTLPLAAND